MDTCGVERYTKQRMWDVAKHRNIMMDACGVESYTKQRWMLVGLKAYMSERDKGTTKFVFVGP
jgi:hypothetical protein